MRYPIESLKGYIYIYILIYKGDIGYFIPSFPTTDQQ